MDSSNDEALDIIVTNVVATFRTRCHLNLRTIALEGSNVIYKPEVGKVLMKLRKPKITASIWSSGKIICTGATSEDEAKLGARRLARCLQKLGFKVRFSAFRVVNVLAVCSMPFAVHLIDFTKNNRPIASYEPELHPAATYRIKISRPPYKCSPLAASQSQDQMYRMWPLRLSRFIHCCSSVRNPSANEIQQKK
ncbi:hypothetical protein INR49_004071 [Caranx melampygus]|nr:hypothetical protein INR49_004071 [Caranx melampygus]